jgi:predicted O-methyltransferase YrrM
VGLVSAEIDRYLEGLAPERAAPFHDMEALGRERGFPIVGPAVGALLAVLARAVGARTVFEAGSGFGYSAAWWLEGLPPDGRVVLTDFDPAHAARGTAFLERLGHAGRFRWVVGDALSALEREAGPFDVVFCDADKEAYPRFVEPAVRRLRPGGLLVADNALWGGTVADPACREPATAAVREYLERVTRDPRLATTVVPLRDGVAVSLRLPG